MRCSTQGLSPTQPLKSHVMLRMLSKCPKRLSFQMHILSFQLALLLRLYPVTDTQLTKTQRFCQDLDVLLAWNIRVLGNSTLTSSYPAVPLAQGKHSLNVGAVFIRSELIWENVYRSGQQIYSETCYGGKAQFLKPCGYVFYDAGHRLGWHSSVACVLCMCGTEPDMTTSLESG